MVAGVGAAVVFGWGGGVASATETSDAGRTSGSGDTSESSGRSTESSGSSGSSGSSSVSSESGSTSSATSRPRDPDDGQGPLDDAGVAEDESGIDDAGVADDDGGIADDGGIDDDGGMSDADRDRDDDDRAIEDGGLGGTGDVADVDGLDDDEDLTGTSSDLGHDTGANTETVDTGADTQNIVTAHDRSAQQVSTSSVDITEAHAVHPAPPGEGGDTSPLIPAVPPQAWAMAAAARRELAADAVHQSVPVSDTTGEVLAAPANTVNYTATPTLFDALTAAGLFVLQGISQLIGVDLVGVVHQTLASDRPPPSLTTGLQTRLTEYEASEDNTWQVWEFHPPNPTGKAVVAVHGGFTRNPLVTHWIDYTSMARATGATVIVPLYPPTDTEAGPATTLAMAQFLSGQLVDFGADNVSIYADAAGANLTLSAVRHLILSGEPLPATMVLLSLTPDATLSNAAMADIGEPLAGLPGHSDEGPRQTGSALIDPVINVLSFEDAVLAALPATTIYVGSLESILPETLALHHKWSAAGGTVSTVIGQGQIRSWAVAGSPNSQTATVRPDIYRQLGLNGVAAGPRTITTGPPSYSDRLIADTLRFLRWFSKTTGISLFSGVVGNVTSTDPPSSATLGLTVTEREFNGWTVWELAAPQPSGEYVVALHGGGFAAEANILQWSDYGQMARDTGATVLVPIYPLAPPQGTGTATTLVPPMADYLSLLIDAHGVQNVSVYGDSSGGSFAVLAVQELIRRCRAAVSCVLTEAQPSRMVLVSPALHITLRSPEVEAIDDPILPRWDVDEIPGYNGELDFDDYRVNPISSDDLTGLPPTALYIGTQEQLYPGALAFRDKLLAQDPDADFTVIIGDGQLHGWALGGIVINSQAPLWRSTVYRQLGLLPEVNSARIATVSVA